MRSSCAIVLAFGFAPLAWSEEKKVESPAYVSWAKQKLGTTVTQKMITNAAGNISETTMSFKLMEVKDDKVVLQVNNKVKTGGMEFAMPATAMNIDKMIPEVKLPEALEKGEETLKIGGKDYKTKWTKYKGKNGDKEYETKAWTSDEVPNLTLKSIIKTTGIVGSTTTVEVTEIKVP